METNVISTNVHLSSRLLFQRLLDSYVEITMSVKVKPMRLNSVLLYVSIQYILERVAKS
jgi:hypothetical protein